MGGSERDTRAGASRGGDAGGVEKCGCLHLGLQGYEEECKVNHPLFSRRIPGASVFDHTCTVMMHTCAGYCLLGLEISSLVPIVSRLAGNGGGGEEKDLASFTRKMIRIIRASEIVMVGSLTNHHASRPR